MRGAEDSWGLAPLSGEQEEEEEEEEEEWEEQNKGRRRVGEGGRLPSDQINIFQQSVSPSTLQSTLGTLPQLKNNSC